MKTKTEKFNRHALSNAARIALTVGLRYDGRRPHGPELCDDITEAARALATVETGPGFAWNEDPAVDWESVCEVLAHRIERGDPVTVGSVRRVIAEFGAAAIN